MLSSYLKTTLRNLWKNKLFVIFNTLGLGTALACCIVAYLNWDYNSSFDDFHVDADKIYRVNFIRITNGNPIQNGSCPLPLGEQIRTSIGQVDQVVRINPTGGNFRIGSELFGTSVSCVDDNFFDVFSFKMLHSEPEALKDQRSIVISDELRDRHFPDLDNPIGETMTYISGDKRIDFRIAGVFEEPPQNSSFYSMHSYVNYENLLEIEDLDATDWARFNTTLVKVNNASDIPLIEEQLQEYVEIQNRAKEDYKVERYYLDPMVGMAVRAQSQNVWNHWLNWSLPPAAAVAPGIMAIMLLLLACFNFTNTSIAIANRRIKEIGVRKVLGSSKRQLVYQFLGENLILTFVALVVGMGIAYFLVPYYSQMWAFLEISFNPLEDTRLVLFLIALLLFTGFTAGSYPAFYVSSFQPSAIFSKKIKFSGTNVLTRILLTLQFAMSLIAIICGFLFAANADYQNEYDLGFDFNSALTAYVKDESGYMAMRNELSNEPAIQSMAGSTHSVTRSWYTDPIKIDESEMDVSIMNIGSGYLETVGATLIDGRDFQKNSASDEATGVIVNEELVRISGWADPVGQRIVLRDTIQLRVVGVVRDIFIQGALWEPIEPLMMRYVPQEKFRFLTVRTDPANISKIKGTMDAAWKRVYPDELSTVQAMDYERAETTEVNANIKVLFLFLGLVAVLLSIFGLYSLVSLNVNKRMKEMGVRKVLGASISHIAVRIGREFMIILLIASVIGSVGAFFLAEMLMASIWAYYTPASPMAFALSIIILAVVSILTIGGKVFKTATINPAFILRDE